MRGALAAALCALAACAQPPPADGGRAPALADADAVLLVTSNLRGVLEPCYCAGEMYGGLARKASLVAAYRDAFPRAVVVDAGDALATGAPGDPRNRFVLHGYRQIGYDAVVLGAGEWTAPGLAHVLAPGGPTFVSTNVRSARARLPLTPAFRRDGLAVLSYLPAESGVLPKGRAQALRFAPAADVARRVRERRAQGDRVVLVVHGADDAVARAAAAFRPDLIVQGRFTAPRAEVRRVAGVPVVRTGGYGYVSVLAFRGRDVEHRYERVDRRWPAVEALLETYDAYAAAALAHAHTVKRSEGRAYVPSAACADCHAGQYEAWKKHRHAHAYATLESVERSIDPDCLRCHTSGFTSTGGFYSMERTPGLANVNCQDCHEVDFDEHVAMQSAPPVTERTCRRCHTPDTDPKFDFETRRAHVGCCAGD